MMTFKGAPLIERYGKECVMIEKKRIPDGLGGFRDEYTEGEKFVAAIVSPESTLSQIAEKLGATGVYDVYTPKGVGLDFHEAFKRLEDGLVLRVTSMSRDTAPPDGASFTFEKVKAETWVIPS